MDFLIFAQTLFYFSFSLVIIVVGVLLCVFLYHVVAVSRHIHRGFDNITTVTSGIFDKISILFGRLVGSLMEVVGNHKKGSKKK